MPFLRFIALLTLPALLLGFSGLGGVDVTGGSANAQIRLECKKVVQLLAVPRVEQIKTVASPDHNPGKTLSDGCSFTAPVFKPIWRVAAILPVTARPHLAPSLTGIVVLQI